MDRQKLLATVSGIVCAVVLLVFIVVIAPTNSAGSWPADWIGIGVLVFFAPLAVLLWAIITPAPWRRRPASSMTRTRRGWWCIPTRSATSRRFSPHTPR